MSSRSLAAAKAKRTGDQAPPVSGNRPITSIGSHAAFAPQPVHPNNVRVARSMQPPQQQQMYQQQQQQQMYQQQQQMYQQQQPAGPQPKTNGLPFSKLTVSDAIGLITLRLGRVEQWIIDTDHETADNGTAAGVSTGIPDNHKIIDNSVLTTIINRLDSLEKNGGNGQSGFSSEEVSKLAEEVKIMKEQIARIGEDVTKHTLELAKNTEQVFRFNRELVETKDILKSFMVKYDMFAQETTQNFSDYDTALADLEARVLQTDETPIDNIDIPIDSEEPVGTSLSDIDADNIVMTVDLKNIIKQELANTI